MWGHVVAPLYCLLWFPQGTFYTIRQHKTCGSSSWSKIKYPGSHEPWAVRCRDHHLSSQHAGDSKTRTQGQPAGEAVGSAQTEHGRTDGIYLQEGARIYVTWSQRQARRPVLSWWQRKGARSREAEAPCGSRRQESRSRRPRRSLSARGLFSAGVSPSLRRPSGPPAHRLHQEPVAKLGRKQVSSEAKQGATWFQAAPAADPTSSRRRRAAQEAQV